MATPTLIGCRIVAEGYTSVEGPVCTADGLQATRAAIPPVAVARRRKPRRETLRRCATPPPRRRGARLTATANRAVLPSAPSAGAYTTPRGALRVYIHLLASA